MLGLLGLTICFSKSHKTKFNGEKVVSLQIKYLYYDEYKPDTGD